MESNKAIPTQKENPNGLHGKYYIQKITATGLSPITEGAEYFVLRLDDGAGDKNHLAACRIAIHAYADAISAHIPQLAADLKERYANIDIFTATGVVETLRDLKTFINSLSDEQLDNPVRVWGIDGGCKINSAGTLDEEYVCTESSEGMMPLSECKNDEDFTEDEITARLPVGTPILHTEDI